MKDRQFSISKFKELCAEKAKEYAKYVANGKFSLLKLIETEEPLGKWHSVLMAIAQNQAAHDMCIRFAETHESYNNGDKILLFLLRDALANSDDTWSGRQNDFRRTQRDGEREALKEIKDILEYYSYEPVSD